MKIALFGRISHRNYQTTVHCLDQLGYEVLQLCPENLDLKLKEMNRSRYLILQECSSDFRQILKIRKFFKGTLINYWMGSDVFNTFYNKKRLLAIKLSQLLVDKNWAVGDRLIGPLSQLGISARAIPHHIFSHKGLPTNPKRKLGIVVYYPEVSGRQGMTAFELHGIKAVFEIAEKLPSFRFYLVGGGSAIINAPTNVRFLGPIENLSSYWAEADYYMRLSVSDGLPKMLLEALEYSIMPIANFPYFRNIWLFENPEQISDKIMVYEQYAETMNVLLAEAADRFSLSRVGMLYRAELEP